MQIANDQVVSISFKVSDTEGKVLDSTEMSGPLTYLHGHQNIIPGLEQALHGKSLSDQLTVVIEPEDAYGPVYEDMIQEVPVSAFQGIDAIEPGMSFEAQGANGETRSVVVTKVKGEVVTVDGNHPLAGETLHFELTIDDIRAASEEEIAHGHAEGAEDYDPEDV